LTFSSHDSVSGNALGCSFDYNTVIFSLRGGNRTIVGNGMRSRLITRPRDAMRHVFLRNCVNLTQKEAEVSKNLTEFTDLR